MRRRTAVLLGVLWLGSLMGINGALILRPDNLRAHVDEALATLIRSKVTYGSFEGGWPGNLTLRDVYIYHPDDPNRTVVIVEELEIVVDWTAPLFGGNPVEELRLKQSTVELAWNVQGRLDVPAILSEGQQGAGDVVPRIRVEGLELSLLNSPFLIKDDVDIDLKNLRLLLIPERSGRGLYQFSAEVKSEQVGDIRANGRFGPRGLDLEISRRGFEVTEELKEILAPQVAEMVGRFSVDGDLELVGELDSDPESGGAATFKASINLAKVDVSIHSWPQKITGLEGVIRYEDGRFEAASRVTGWLEGARLSFKGFCDFSQGAPQVSVRGSLIDLAITDAFVDRLAELPDPGSEVREQLEQWRVRGPADVDFFLRQEPRVGEEAELVPDITVTLKDCRLTYEGPRDADGRRRGFPYPLENVRGAINLDHRGLRFRPLQATQGLLSVQANGSVDYARDGEGNYHTHVWASGLPIDGRLLDALDPESAEIVRSLRAEGTVDIQVVAQRARRDTTDTFPEVVLTLQGIRLEPESFPYLLEDVRGQIVLKQNAILVDALTARHRGARFDASGEWGINADAGRIRGELVGRHLILDGELLEGLQELVPEAADALDTMGARGKIPDLSLSVNRSQLDTEPTFDLSLRLAEGTIQPRDPAVVISGVDLSLDVWHGPNRSEIAIRPGARGEIVGRAFTAEGRIRLGGGWRLEVASDGFALGDDLLDALAPLIPTLSDPNDRPHISGQADASVTINGTPEGTVLNATIEVRGASVQPPTWHETRLEDLSCTLIVEPGVVRVQGLRAVIPRPGISNAGAPSRPRSLTEPFAAEPGIQVSLMSGGIVRQKDGIELGMSDVELVGVPIEPWVLEIFGLTRAQRQDLGVLPIAGMMNVRFTTAKLGADRLILNGGRADLSGIHLGSSADFYLERGVLKDVSVSADREGNLRFGGPDTVFEGTNFQLFGVPVPKIEARLHGDRFGAELSRIRGVLFGYEFPAQQGQGVDPRPAGVIWEEETRLAVTWDGDFSFDAHLRDVEIASAVRALGGAPQGVRGRLSARLAIGGHVGDVGSWQGSGWVSADAINVVHLPLFLNILKAIDPTTWSLNRSPRTRIRFEFDVGDSVVRLREGGSLSSDNLRLALMPGGTVTFGGIINARLDASHRSGSIPVVSELLSALPSILLDGVVVQGPLEDPVVEPRSFGIGGDTGTSGSGRRPRMKPLKNENDR